MGKLAIGNSGRGSPKRDQTRIHLPPRSQGTPAFALGSLTPPESRQHQLKAEHSLHTAPLVPMYPADGIIHRAMGLVDMVHRAITHTPGLGYILSPCGIVMCLI